MRMKGSVIGFIACLTVAPFAMAESPPVESTPIVGNSTAITSEPIISDPVAAPVTSQPVTSAPVTSTPVTSAPVTSSPVASVSTPVVSKPEVVPQPVKPVADKLKKLPNSGVAVPRGFITRPSIAMVSPLGIKMNSSPAGFNAAPGSKKKTDKAAKEAAKSESKTAASQPTAANPAVAPAAGSTTQVVGSSNIASTGAPEAGTVTESVTVEEKKPDEFNPNDYIEKQTEWTYASRYKDGSIKKDTYCPLVSVSLGYGRTGNLGTSNYFSPAVSDGTNFYNFNDNTPIQSQTVYGFFAGYELVLDPMLSMQAGLGYYQSGSFNARGLLTQGATPATATTYGYNYHVSSQRWLIETKFLYNRRKIHPYLMAGVGAALNKSSGFKVNSDGATTYQFGNSTTGSATYSVGFGVDFDLASDVRIGLGYRFSDYGRYKLSRGVIGPVVTTNDLGQAHLYVNEILAQFMLFF